MHVKPWISSNRHPNNAILHPLVCFALPESPLPLNGGGAPPAEIAGERVWGHAPRHVAIASNINHEGARLYL